MLGYKIMFPGGPHFDDLAIKAWLYMPDYSVMVKLFICRINLTAKIHVDKSPDNKTLLMN